jgi:hypothetical protein
MVLRGTAVYGMLVLVCCALIAIVCGLVRELMGEWAHHSKMSNRVPKMGTYGEGDVKCLNLCGICCMSGRGLVAYQCKCYLRRCSYLGRL